MLKNKANDAGYSHVNRDSFTSHIPLAMSTQSINAPTIPN